MKWLTKMKATDQTIAEVIISGRQQNVVPRAITGLTIFQLTFMLSIIL